MKNGGGEGGQRERERALATAMPPQKELCGQCYSALSAGRLQANSKLRAWFGHCFDLFHRLRPDTVLTMASNVNNRDPGAASGHPRDNISPRSVLNYSSNSRRSFTGSCNGIHITYTAESFVMHRQIALYLTLPTVGVIIIHRDFVLSSEMQIFKRNTNKCNPRYTNELTPFISK
jgi:hypothetical protein